MKSIVVLVLSILLSASLTAVVSAEQNNTNGFLFILGTDINEDALQNAALKTSISEELDTTIITNDDTVPEGFDLSGYSMIFIESYDEAIVSEWTNRTNAAKTNGTMVIGYNLSRNITLTNVDLYSDEYTDIERYWVQGGDTNMESMLKLMVRSLHKYGKMKLLVTLRSFNQRSM
jgi:cobaltochelatase CobN